MTVDDQKREVNALIEDVRAQARFTKRVKRLIKEYVQITGSDPPPPLYEVRYHCEKRLEAIQDQAMEVLEVTDWEWEAILTLGSMIRNSR